MVQRYDLCIETGNKDYRDGAISICVQLQMQEEFASTVCQMTELCPLWRANDNFNRTVV